MQLRPLCTSELAVKAETASGEAFSIRCKRWSCPVCREVNRRKVIQIAKDAKPRALLTLTVSSTQYPGIPEAALALKRGLRLLRLRLKRHPKLTNFQFLAVFEKHKSGHPHLHLVIKGKFIPWAELKAAWEAITGSTGIYIQFIRSTGQAAAYCAKYIGKDLAQFEGCKRWWRSHGFIEAKAEDYSKDHPRERWERTAFGLFALIDGMEAAGWIVERQRGERFRWSAPPDTGELPHWRQVAATAAVCASPWGDAVFAGPSFGGPDVRERGRRRPPSLRE